VGGFGKLPSSDQLTALRDELRQAAEDSKTVVDLVASLPPADFCSKDTVFAALRPKEFGYGYYSGDQIHVHMHGKTDTVAAADYRTLANERAIEHSHAKHSQYKGRPFMVGSLARLTVNGDMLNGSVAAVKQRFGLNLPSGNPMDNNKAQAVELVYDIGRALATVEQLIEEGLRPEAPVAVTPRAGTGTAITEAPRGMLVHSYVYDGQGRIVSADVITPTAFNAASLEEHLRRTAEQSIEEDTPTLTRKLEMIVRAYDPCISCSVHVLDMRDAP